MITTFDIAVIAIVLLSTLFATMRGFTREILAVVTWGGSAIIAWYVFNTYPDVMRNYITADTLIADAVTIVGTFLVSLIVLHVVTAKFADLILDSAIGPLDRTLGIVFGAFRGIVIVVVLFGFTAWLFGPKGWATGLITINPENSMTGPYVERFWESGLTVLPDDWQSNLRDLTQIGSSDPSNGTVDQFGEQ